MATQIDKKYEHKDNVYGAFAKVVRNKRQSKKVEDLVGLSSNFRPVSILEKMWFCGKSIEKKNTENFQTNVSKSIRSSKKNAIRGLQMSERSTVNIFRLRK